MPPNGKPNLQPDVVLIDVGTFAQSAPELEGLIREYARVAPVLLLMREDRLEMLLVGLKGGAVGFVEQTASIDELKKAIVALAEGSTWWSVKVYVSNLLRKSGVSNRSGLAHYAVARTLARTQPSPQGELIPASNLKRFVRG